MTRFDPAQVMTAGCLCFRTRRLSRLITRAYDEALRPTGLQATQLTLLNAVAMGGADGQPMPRLTSILAMDATTLSRNLRPLEREGLIGIRQREDDRRARVAWVTPAGEARLEAALPFWRQAHSRIEAALGPDLADGLREGLDAAAGALSN
ncbi:MarR family winged helix-turn-helix transcriptional regulator [Sphingosinicella terrae]|uniref:MarR family winged helix-turn-helix transcriptional regulator n=1 Tax=Sphingosinicella terrae TaxID=2172047 RepID=UPI000E0D2915|nr:MarR family winged helix-turn-helix transcriptional regulator [Sphingosinicella terrae]